MSKTRYKPVKQWLEYAYQDLLAAREIANRNDLHPQLRVFYLNRVLKKH